MYDAIVRLSTRSDLGVATVVEYRPLGAETRERVQAQKRAARKARRAAKKAKATVTPIQRYRRKRA
jgi:hypothetical protein